ncbi:MAG: acetyl-CoA carboxylase carboxyl transferase subunit beta [Ruminococcus sp.]|jgi:acetyl-CoA carboxylase carboxyl transferase subunit beta|nr:acetyl-CoA carboxylase carboxyl transferase subunit beta [Ruminococcus sp.]
MNTLSQMINDRKEWLMNLKNSREQVQQSHKQKEPLCPSCGEARSLTAMYACKHCGHLYAVPSEKRLLSLFDEGTAKTILDNIEQTDPLAFPDYEAKLLHMREKSGLNDAYSCLKGNVDGMAAVAMALDNRFFMGSMGTVLGEAVARMFEYALRKKLPVIIFTSSGGARMQEGIFSLMQMAKTSAAVERHSAAGLLYISVMVHPTTGGVTASFASLADITLAEPNALIGFAGPRVVEQTIGRKMPAGFQRSEFQLEHGFIDSIVKREDMKNTISQILELHSIGGMAEK